eukprot:14256933-Ditylum_brightwellii.AAC.1
MVNSPYNRWNFLWSNQNVFKSKPVTVMKEASSPQPNNFSTVIRTKKEETSNKYTLFYSSFLLPPTSYNTASSNKNEASSPP